jgi:hypothetical protein
MNPYQNTPEKEDSASLSLYNKATIFFTAALMNTFIGAIFYSMNLSRIGKKNQIPPILIFGLFWNGLCLYFLPILKITNIYLRIFLPNLLGGLILISFLWDYQLKNIGIFRMRSPIIPILTVVALWGLGYTLRYYHLL